MPEHVSVEMSQSASAIHKYIEFNCRIIFTNYTLQKIAMYGLKFVTVVGSKRLHVLVNVWMYARKYAGCHFVDIKCKCVIFNV